MSTNLPLSGDVSQVINPWTFWSKYLNQQLGFINIYNLKSGDAEIEEKIINDVASYGRQLGWITQVLELVVSRQKLDDLTEEESASLHKFFDLIRQTEEVKQRFRQAEGKHAPVPPLLTLANLDLMINDIRAMKKRDERTYREMVSRIKDAFSNE